MHTAHDAVTAGQKRRHPPVRGASASGGRRSTREAETARAVYGGRRQPQAPSVQVMPLGQSQSFVQLSGVGRISQTPLPVSHVRPSGQLQLARQVKKHAPSTQRWSVPHSRSLRHSTAGSSPQ